MARKKEFDPQKAVQQAMEVFWEKGYDGTTLDDLCIAMNIRRGSLYGTFKDKRSLYMEAINQYVLLNYPTELASINGTSPLTIIRQLFQKIVDEVVSDKQQRGCLMINTITELSHSDDPEIAQITKFCYTTVENIQLLFVNLLAEAQSQGEIEANVNINAKAQFLFNALIGIRITSMVKRDRQMLENIMEETLTALKV